jgi:hypothetical protein
MDAERVSMRICWRSGEVHAPTWRSRRELCWDAMLIGGPDLSAGLTDATAYKDGRIYRLRDKSSR